MSVKMGVPAMFRWSRGLVLSLGIFAFVIGGPAFADEGLKALTRPGTSGNIAVMVTGRTMPGVSAKSVKDPLIIAQHFLEREGSRLGLTDIAKQLMPIGVDSDSEGYTHVRFSQAFGDVALYGSGLTVHVKADGAISSVTGRVSDLHITDTQPLQTKEQAIVEAKELWAAEFGMDDGGVRDARLYVFDSKIINAAGPQIGGLAWVIEMYSGGGERGYKYILDATKGGLFHRSSTVRNLNRRVYDCSFGNGICYLNAKSTSYEYPFGRSEGRAPVGSNPIESIKWKLDTDRIYNGIGFSHDYFRRYGRDGANYVGGTGDGAEAPYTDAGSYTGLANKTPSLFVEACPNAFWSPGDQIFSFCEGRAIIDTIGHEYTHAVEHYTLKDAYGRSSGFESAYESGALSEGFADVFGEAIERHALGYNNWMKGVSGLEIGEGGNIRDLSHPELGSSKGPSSKYSSHYQCDSSDDGGIHTNCLVLGHAAYRIAMGDSGNGCVNEGIGQPRQEAIFYRALSAYSAPTSNFESTWAALILSCGDLYGGIDSWECKQVAKAVNAVMMDQGGKCSGVAATKIDCDDCPTDPTKSRPGACGCGYSDADANGNGTPDCREPALAEVVPDPPKVALTNRSLLIKMTPMEGAKYQMKVVVKGSRGSKTRYHLIGAPNARIDKLPSGSSVSVSYSYVIEGSPEQVSRFSAVRRVRIK